MPEARFDPTDAWGKYDDLGMSPFADVLEVTKPEYFDADNVETFTTDRDTGDETTT